MRTAIKAYDTRAHTHTHTHTHSRSWNDGLS